MTKEEGLLQEMEQLSKEYLDYIEHYRKKICVKCTSVRKKARKGRDYPSGCYCDHMMNARVKKLGHKADKLILNLLESEEAQKCQD